MKQLINNFIDSIGKDKLLHFTVGYLIYFFSFFCLYQFTKINEYTCTLWALVPVIVAALIREIGWRNANLEESVLDFTYTVLGAVPMFAMINYILN